VGTAIEALEALERQEFDCMVLDLGLPDMSRFDLIDQVQERQQHRTLPIIVYTGSELSQEQQNRLKGTTDTVIIKNARSPERLLAETALFLHRVESNLPEEKQHMIRQVREHDPRLLGRRVLVVDDDMRNIFALTSILESRGMEVAYAENGEAALALLQSGADSVDVVLIDVMMPGMDGYQTTREIRRRPGLEKLPVIAVTAKAMKGDREKCLEAGANDYMAKPVDTDQLLSILRVWLYDPNRAQHSAD
jgi:CheY-like chemotaxis protein